MQCKDESASGLVSVAFVYISSLKMVVPLFNFTVVEQRAVIHYLCSEGVKVSENHRRILAQYCEHCKAQKIYTNKRTDLNAEGQILMMKNDQIGLRYYEQTTIVPGFMH
jgi:hypothetical protein